MNFATIFFMHFTVIFLAIFFHFYDPDNSCMLYPSLIRFPSLLKIQQNFICSPYFSTNLCALSNQPNFGNSFEFLDNRQLVASIREKVETHFDLCFLLDYSIFSVIMVIQHFIATSKQQSVTKAWDFFVKCSAKKICVENCGLVYIEGECTHSPKVIRYMIEIRLFRFLSSDLNIEFSRGGRPRNVASRSQISTLNQWASVSLEATDIVLEQEQILFAIT